MPFMLFAMGVLQTR